MLLTFNRPKALNALTFTMEEDINRILNWFDNEPSLWFVHTFPVHGSSCLKLH